MPAFIRRNLWIRVPVDVILFAIAIYAISTDPHFYGFVFAIALCAAAFALIF